MGSDSSSGIAPQRIQPAFVRHRAAKIRDRPDQRLRVGMMRRRHRVFAWRGFYRLAAIHYINFIRPLAQHLQVVADQQNGGVVILVQTREQAENLARWLAPSRSLVRPQSADAADSRGDGNHHFLAFTVGQFVGKLRIASLWSLIPTRCNSSMARRLRQPKRCHQRPL